MGKASSAKRPGRRINPNSLKNLRPPIQKGEVRNPKGINRKTPWSTENYVLSGTPLPEKLRLRINKRVGVELLKKGVTWAQANSIQLGIGAVMDGEVAASRELRESVEGKAMQRMELTGAEGQPLLPPKLEIVFPETAALTVAQKSASDSKASDASESNKAKD